MVYFVGFLCVVVFLGFCKFSLFNTKLSWLRAGTHGGNENREGLSCFQGWIL